MKLEAPGTCVLVLLAFFSASVLAAGQTLSYTIGYVDDVASQGTDLFTVELLTTADGVIVPPSQLAATCGIGWNRDYLTLAVDVRDDDCLVATHDDHLWAYDSVEVFLAPSVGGGSYYQLVMAVDKSGELRSKFYDFRNVQTTGLAHASTSTRTDAGYRITARLPWSNLDMDVEAGSEIGMQLFVNDAGPNRDTTQLQWYPHAVSHSSDRMHRLRLETTTTDNHLTACLVGPGYDYHRLDILMRREHDLREFDVLNSDGKKLAAGYFHPTRQGLQHAAVLLETLSLKQPAEIQFVSDGRVIGKAAISEPATISGDLLKDLQNMTLVPKNRWGYLFEVGAPPALGWSTPQAMRTAAGSDEVEVRWFDAELNEVADFDRPGRYLAVAEARLLDGRTLRRAATFYAYPTNAHPWRNDVRLTIYNRSRPWWHPWRGKPHAEVEYIPGLHISEENWQQHQPILSAWAGREFFAFLESDPYGPILLSFLSEADHYTALPKNAQTPEIIDNEMHLALKRKLMGIENGSTALRLPDVLSDDQAAPTLTAGTAEQAGFKPGSEAALRRLCQEWANASGEPFVLLLARDGVVFFHEAFGDDPARPVAVDTPMFMASVTKCMSGLLLAQFVDQGLLAIDQPVGDFLPEFPRTGEKAITFRHCFTHTTGMQGHYEFGGMHNPWLENALALELETLPVGRVHEYNGMGYDLAGKAMEIAGGKSAFRLMHEHLYAPLGMADTVIDDMATCSYSTAMDLARMGQLILNKGSYGNRRFFSSETLEAILPTDLNAYYPAIQKNWGIGFTWMLQQRPQPNDAKSRYLLSNRVLGHGAASSALFRVDLVNNVILTQTRSIAGAEYDAYVLKLLTLVDDLMESKQ